MNYQIIILKTNKYLFTTAKQYAIIQLKTKERAVLKE